MTEGDPGDGDLPNTGAEGVVGLLADPRERDAVPAARPRRDGEALDVLHRTHLGDHRARLTGHPQRLDGRPPRALGQQPHVEVGHGHPPADIELDPLPGRRRALRALCRPRGRGEAVDGRWWREVRRGEQVVAVGGRGDGHAADVTRDRLVAGDVGLGPLVGLPRLADRGAGGPEEVRIGVVDESEGAVAPGQGVRVDPGGRRADHLPRRNLDRRRARRGRHGGGGQIGEVRGEHGGPVAAQQALPGELHRRLRAAGDDDGGVRRVGVDKLRAARDGPDLQRGYPRGRVAQLRDEPLLRRGARRHLRAERGGQGETGGAQRPVELVGGRGDVPVLLFQVVTQQDLADPGPGQRRGEARGGPGGELALDAVHQPGHARATERDQAADPPRRAGQPLQRLVERPAPLVLGERRAGQHQCPAVLGMGGQPVRGGHPVVGHPGERPGLQRPAGERRRHAADQRGHGQHDGDVHRGGRDHVRSPAVPVGSPAGRPSPHTGGEADRSDRQGVRDPQRDRQPHHRLELVDVAQEAQLVTEQVPHRARQRAARMPRIGRGHRDRAGGQRHQQEPAGGQIGPGQPPQPDRRHGCRSDDRHRPGHVLGGGRQPGPGQLDVRQPVRRAAQGFRHRRRRRGRLGGLGEREEVQPVASLHHQRQQPPGRGEDDGDDPPGPQRPGPAGAAGEHEDHRRTEQDAQRDRRIDSAGAQDGESGQGGRPSRGQPPARVQGGIVSSIDIIGRRGTDGRGGGRGTGGGGRTGVGAEGAVRTQREDERQGDPREHGGARERHGGRPDLAEEHRGQGVGESGEHPGVRHAEPQGLGQPHDPPGGDGEDQRDPQPLGDPGGYPEQVTGAEERSHREQVADVLVGQVAELGEGVPQMGGPPHEAPRVEGDVQLGVSGQLAGGLEQREHHEAGGHAEQGPP